MIWHVLLKLPALWLLLAFQMSDLSAIETRKQFEEQNLIICDLRNRLEDAELKLVEGEKLRKKLHNTILVVLSHNLFCQELKATSLT